LKKSGTSLGTIIVIVVVCAAVIGTAAWWFTKEKPAPPLRLEENAAERNIRIGVEEVTLHYQETRLWSENYFLDIMENQFSFQSSQINQFNKTYNVNAGNFEVTFDEEQKSTLLKCDVSGKISKSGGRYTATLLWFLNPLGLDFIDDDFNESKTSLSWRGKINEVQTIITIDLPAQDSVYEDWSRPVGHCHGHIWWPVSSEGQKIMIVAEKEILHYQETHTWSDNQFGKLAKNKSRAKSEEIDNFKETYDVSADNFRVEFNEKKNSTTLKCDVHGKLSGSTYTFHWLLDPLGLDFINSDFVKSERKLSWKGSINEITTTITLRFPFTINHCHAHVWPA